MNSDREDEVSGTETERAAALAEQAPNAAGEDRVSIGGAGADPWGTLQKERDAFYDQLLRKQAEFENYRRRVEREKADSRFNARREILHELLTVLDACERGLQSMDQHEASLESYKEGYGLLHRQLRSILSKFGVEAIEAVGQQFDPNIHEAIVHQQSDAHPDGEIIGEIQKGYRLHERLLRPAQVKVARSDSAKGSE
jgi:molecular chaperone GrpE